MVTKARPIPSSEQAETSSEQAGRSDSDIRGSETEFLLMLTVEQKEYIERGKSRRKNFCQFSRYYFESIMLPPVPNQTRIDVYPDEIEKKLNNNPVSAVSKEQTIGKNTKQKKKEQSPDPKSPAKVRDEIVQRGQYEGEVIVYRALEELEEKLICLHSFEYTAHQFNLWRCKLIGIK